MKIGEWVILWLHKRYSIPTTARITKKLTQQYIGLFQIVKKVGCLAYKLDIPFYWWIHSVFFVIQLEPAPPLAEDLFIKSFRPIYLPCLWRVILIS